MRRPKPLRDLRYRHAQEEHDLIEDALVRCGWSLTRAALQLEVGVSTLQALIQKHRLADDYERHKLARGRPRNV